MNWVIVGQGALGSLLAIKLQQQGHSVAILCRPEQRPQPRWFGDQRYDFAAADLSALNSSTEPYTIIAAVKAYQLTELLNQLGQLPPHCQLLLSYNGMLDNEAEQLPQHCLHWVTTHGVYLDQQQLVHAGQGQSWLGWQQLGEAVPQAIVNALGQALPPLQWQTAIGRQRWHKLAINCLINPLTVVHNCLNGRLLELGLEPEMLQLAQEISVLAARLAQLDMTAEQLLAQAQQVARNTASNRSSMLTDVLAGRTTEIDYLNGFVARESAALGLTASANHRLWQLVRQRSS